MVVLRLRCKTEIGTQVLNNLTSSSTVSDLMEAIQSVTGVEILAQKIMVGFPPKSIDLSDGKCTLDSLSIHSGDTFTVVDKEKASKSKKQVDSDSCQPTMKRKEVPADNSCLFYSVYYAMEGYLEYEIAKRLRGRIAERVMTDPEQYSEVVLGKTQEEYSAWIQSDTSWGGAIELSILCEVYRVEIAAVDIKTTRLDIYGQDKGFSSRVFLIYDGIHYDPLYLDPGVSDLPIQTIFPCSDDIAMLKVLEVAESAQKARQFTDTQNFTIICLTCQKKLKGQHEAQTHAKETGHGNFSEC